MWSTCMKTFGMDITWSHCWRSSLEKHWWVKATMFCFFFTSEAASMPKLFNFNSSRPPMQTLIRTVTGHSQSLKVYTQLNLTMNVNTVATIWQSVFCCRILSSGTSHLRFNLSVSVTEIFKLAHISVCLHRGGSDQCRSFSAAVVHCCLHPLQLCSSSKCLHINFSLCVCELFSYLIYPSPPTFPRPLPRLLFVFL